MGYKLAMRFTKGKHAFVVATHTDRQHIHNHVIFNSTALDGSRKFRDFFFSAWAVQRLSDLICLEHQLSVIEKKPYRERQKRIVYPPKESNRDRLCGIIDTILAEKPGDYETFLQKLERQGYEVKRGKYTSVKGKWQKRFIRFRTLGTGYGEDEIKAVLEGKAKHQPYQKKPPKEQPFQLLVDIQGKMAEGKSVGYKKWATKFNLKEMSKTLLFLQEQKIGSAEELRERATAATERYLSKPPIGYRCEGSAAIPSDRLWKKQMGMGEMHRHRLIATPRITNRIDRQIQLTPFLRLVKASKEHFACCFACSNWDAPA